MNGVIRSRGAPAAMPHPAAEYLSAASLAPPQGPSCRKALVGDKLAGPSAYVVHSYGASAVRFCPVQNTAGSPF